MVDFRVYTYYNKYMKYRMYVRYEGGLYMTISEMKEKKKEKGYTYAQMSVLLSLIHI